MSDRKKSQTNWLTTKNPAIFQVADETEPGHELQGNSKCEENIGKEKRDRE
jgi:hypothetical protein